jgi:hypothetical protein
MTRETCPSLHFPFRGPPGIYVYLHIMAEITEGGSFGEFVHNPSQNYQDEKTNAEE